jgi:hypothetical protein
MVDAYLLATPVLVLGVLSLVRFVGCYSFPDLPRPEPPKNLVAEPGNQQITLTWDPLDIPRAESDWVIKRGAATGVYDNDPIAKIPITQLAYVDQNLPNGLRKFYVVIAFRVAENELGLPSNEADAVPGIGFVLSTTFGTLRTDPFDGWVGMVIQVGAQPLTVLGLGRVFLAGSTGTHAMKIVDGATQVDVPGAATMIDLSKTNVADKAFAYASLPTPITLTPNAVYYVITQQTPGGDHFFDLDTTVLTSGVASVTSAVFGDGVASYTRGGGPGQTYGPVDLLI